MTATADDPRTYDYSAPTRRCDVVMKGGITSGVVYPHAVCELARTYHFASIGGTSAGAIAAAAAAAAEYGRPSGGFARLAVLPVWLGSGTNLFDLFQPQSSTRGLHRTFTAGLGAGGAGKWLRIAAAALRSFPFAPLFGATPGLALVAGAALAGGRAWLVAVAICAGAVFALVGAVLALALRIVLHAPKAISANRFGLCSGMPAGRKGRPALTPWLADLIDDLAGKSDGAPLSFGDLRSSGIELTMMTTNLTQRRPQRLPWPDRAFFFDPAEWRELFPERVVQWMVDHPPPANEDDQDDSERIREAMKPRLPFPAADDLPVVVAARMSLSFPLLISAVPLWAFDRTLKKTNDALSSSAPPGSRAEPERCWFSDGGISSNFPVHFFDAPLPTRPTFAIDLDHFHPDYPKSDDEAKNVYLPSTNVGGLLETWNRFPDGPGLGRFSAFVVSLVRTMQNRVDIALARQPGYRDRIVHIHASDDEGGMNLTMPPPVIKALTRRGQAAARLLVERFADTPGTEPGMSWDNHRWVRYRSSTTALAELLQQVAAGWSAAPLPGERAYDELCERGSAGPAAYRFARKAQHDLARDLTARLVDAGEALAASPEHLEEQSPHPLPRARIVPRD